ncbi:MAG: hypothetical protein ABUS57_02195 [Pseudomonadota bacterium]
MSLVPSDDRLAPRVIPKVFADVPSTAEVQAVKKRSAWLLILVVLLVGMVAAAGLFVVYQSRTIVADQKQFNDHHDDLQRLQARFDGLDKELTGMGAYRDMARVDAQAADLRAQINDLLSNAALRGDAETQISARDWKPFKTPYVWTPSRDEIRQHMHDDVDGLQALLTKIQALPHYTPPDSRHQQLSDPRNN